MRTIALPTSTGPVLTGHNSRLQGYQITNTGATTATVTIASIVGVAGAAGASIEVEIPATSSVDVTYSTPESIQFINGLQVTVSGTVVGLIKYT
jgi:hypothetical protein